MLARALVPLHKMSGLVEYHPPLSYCMVLFCGKDPTLTPAIVGGLLRFWPVGSSAKELLFLQELDELFEFVDGDAFSQFRRRFALRMLKCIECPHVQVAERALWFWNNDAFKALAVGDPRHRKEVLSVLFDALRRCAEGHWHEGVKQLCAHVLSLYRAEDAALVDSMLGGSEARARARSEERARRDMMDWTSCAPTVEISASAGPAAPPPAPVV
jgi:serine/threonine-protein phosphatase 2A regulatory subunit B'